MDYFEHSDQFFADGYDLSRREVEILRTMSEEGDSVIAFQGLKRKLGIHQETLSRLLARLQRDGLIEKSQEGYRIRRKTAIHLPEANRELTLDLINSYLPPSMNLDGFTGGLKGSWFGMLRWLKYVENGSEKILTWITEDGDVQIDMKISDLSMVIQARAKENVDVKKVVIAAHELYGHVSDIYTKQLKHDDLMFAVTSKFTAS